MNRKKNQKKNQKKDQHPFYYYDYWVFKNSKDDEYRLRLFVVISSLLLSSDCCFALQYYYYYYYYVLFLISSINYCAFSFVPLFFYFCMFYLDSVHDFIIFIITITIIVIVITTDYYIFCFKNQSCLRFVGCSCFPTCFLLFISSS